MQLSLSSSRGSRLVPQEFNDSPSALPHNLKKRGRLLMNQQCWLWGRDVKRPEGNLLIEYGFERLRPPEGQEGASQYTLRLGENLFVRLWGFGFYFGGVNGLFLNRFDFTPRRAEFADTWQADSMSRLPVFQNPDLLPAALAWIARYEEWVIENVGTRYRRKALFGWNSAILKPEYIPKAWRGLAEEIYRGDA